MDIRQTDCDLPPLTWSDLSYVIWPQGATRSAVSMATALSPFNYFGCLLPQTLADAYSWAAAVLSDELNAGGFFRAVSIF